MATGFGAREEKIRTVNGDIEPASLGICDGHNHLWIDRVIGVPGVPPILDDFHGIEAELRGYHQRGGQSIVDCQPGGCGRNGNMLRALSRSTSVHVIACTGFHLPKYYPPDYWLFAADAGRAKDYFASEITTGLVETLVEAEPVRAGVIKIACQAYMADTPAALLEAAASAARRTGVAIEVHTEKGSEADKIFRFFQSKGLAAGQLVICHMDKRPDFGLHCELAKSGAVLEYDTFYRPKYEPEKHVWGLIAQMIEAGLEDHMVLATDMAEAGLWQLMGGRPGLGGFLSILLPRLQAMGLNSITIDKLMGGNIAHSLAIRPVS